MVGEYFLPLHNGNKMILCSVFGMKVNGCTSNYCDSL